MPVTCRFGSWAVDLAAVQDVYKHQLPEEPVLGVGGLDRRLKMVD